MIIMKRIVFSLNVACRLSGLHPIVERLDGIRQLVDEIFLLPRFRTVLCAWCTFDILDRHNDYRQCLPILANRNTLKLNRLNHLDTQYQPDPATRKAGSPKSRIWTLQLRQRGSARSPAPDGDPERAARSSTRTASARHPPRSGKRPAAPVERGRNEAARPQTRRVPQNRL